MRALAVLAVVGSHEGASELSGGFLGVDIFFVLSGFLITDLLAFSMTGWDGYTRGTSGPGACCPRWPSRGLHLWSLAIGEQFYIVWPLVLWFFILRLNGPRARIMATLIAASMSALAMVLQYSPGANPSAVY